MSEATVTCYLSLTDHSKQIVQYKCFCSGSIHRNLLLLMGAIYAAEPVITMHSWSNLTVVSCILYVCICVFVCVCNRHMLHPVFCHHHAQHESPQPQRERQTQSAAICLHEQRNQQWGGPSHRAAHGLLLIQTPVSHWRLHNILIHSCLNGVNLKIILPLISIMKIPQIWVNVMSFISSFGDFYSFVISSLLGFQFSLWQWMFVTMGSFIFELLLVPSGNFK